MKAGAKLPTNLLILTLFKSFAHPVMQMGEATQSQNILDCTMHATLPSCEDVTGNMKRNERTLT